MAEKRKPDFIILLKKPGKKSAKIELFSARTFQTNDRKNTTSHPHYRIRSQGKWYGGKGKGKNKDVYSWYRVIRLIYKSTCPSKFGKNTKDKDINLLCGHVGESPTPSGNMAWCRACEQYAAVLRPKKRKPWNRPCLSVKRRLSGLECVAARFMLDLPSVAESFLRTEKSVWELI